MSLSIDELRVVLTNAFKQHDFKKAIAYASELVIRSPEDYRTREILALSLGEAGAPVQAIKIIKAMAENLVKRGFLLTAIGVIKKGMERAPNDSIWADTLLRLHVRAARHQVGKIMAPPPLPPSMATIEETDNADNLLSLDDQSLFIKAGEIGTKFQIAYEEVPPQPLPMFSQLDSQAFVGLIQRSTYKKISAGQTFITEGEPGDALFLIADGEVNIFKHGKKLITLGTGTVVGEMALLTSAKRTATVTAATDIEVFEVSTQLLESMAKEAPQIREQLLEYCRNRLLDNVLRTVPLFKEFSEDARLSLLKMFQRKGYQPETTILEEGQQGVGLFLIVSGSVSVKAKDDSGDQVAIAQLKVGDIFGEISLLQERPTTASITTNQKTIALFLPREQFQQLLFDHPEVKSQLESLSEERLKATDDAREIQEITDFVLL